MRIISNKPKMQTYLGRIIQSASVAMLLIVAMLANIPAKAGPKETYKPVETFFKDVDAQQLKTYEWSEIITEKDRYDIPGAFTRGDVTKEYTGFKTFENTNKITNGKAGWINRISTTNEDGFQIVHDRYLVAVGTHFNMEIGQYFDIVLENGTTIPCIMGDTKADQDTDNGNIFTVHSACATEFIVTQSRLPSSVNAAGDVSKLKPEWESRVAQIVVYENVYDEEQYQKDLEPNIDATIEERIKEVS